MHSFAKPNISFNFNYQPNRWLNLYCSSGNASYNIIENNTTLLKWPCTAKCCMNLQIRMFTTTIGYWGWRSWRLHRKAMRYETTAKNTTQFKKYKIANKLIPLFLWDIS
ncbi:hypothetical protein LOAG_09716 [Loa loa]|uniref:Uncharacterized protein n=1 Tax=Loa loa TaxID=7209 RepID=A0A1S0TRB9_LOALO|nr:hypothetical protein LOAG_09716 [Loa loa]EFO18781.1 hypothetical protein LOAG_09716 [Loa loa]